MENKLREQPFALYAIINPGDEGLEPLKAILPKDGSRGFVVGEDWEIEYLHDLLTAYLETRVLTGSVPHFHEQLGSRWINTGEAVSLALQHGEEIPERTIRWAAKNGYIAGAEKQGRDWRFPMSKFLYWLSNRPKPGRKP